MNATPVTPPGIPTDAGGEPRVTTQGKSGFRANSAAWIRDLPQFGRFKPTDPDPSYQLIDRAKLEKAIARFSDETKAKIYEDYEYAEIELLRLFRERDHTASMNQNRYRLFQIWYILLAGAASTLGGFQALAITGAPNWVPVWAFAETIVALFAVFIATLSTREPPLTRWLDNRRRAEQMRREYFRFLLHLPPYTDLDGYHRKLEVSRRASDIHRGIDPDARNTTGIVREQ